MSSFFWVDEREYTNKPPACKRAPKKCPEANYHDKIMTTAQEFEFPAEYQRQLAEWLSDPVKFPTDKWIIELQKQRMAVGSDRPITS